MDNYTCTRYRHARMGLLLWGFLLSSISAQAQDSDDGQIPLRAEILAPDDNCQLLLGTGGSIGFGQLAQPTGTETASRMLDPVSGAGGPAGTTLAEMTLLTSAPRAFTLMVSAPANLARSSGTGRIDYALHWAERASNGDPYEAVPTTSAAARRLRARSCR